MGAAPGVGGATIVNPGDFAGYVFTVVLGVGGLGVAFGVARRIAHPGPPSRVQVSKEGVSVIPLPGGDTDPGQQAVVGHLADQVEALRGETAALHRELDEVHNRLDFAERLLAQSRERGRLSAPKEP